MLILVSGSFRIAEYFVNSGQARLGQLLSPRNRNSVRAGLPWALDNGAYSGFDADAFCKCLRRYRWARELQSQMCQQPLLF